MKKRWIYALSALVLLLVEIVIGAFVHDAFLRPYGGDILVIMLLAALYRTVFPEKPRHIGLYMIGAGVLAELLQAFDFCGRMGLSGTVFAVLLGTSFSWIDLLCYLAGGIAFDLSEELLIHTKKGE